MLQDISHLIFTAILPVILTIYLPVILTKSVTLLNSKQNLVKINITQKQTDFLTNSAITAIKATEEIANFSYVNGKILTPTEKFDMASNKLIGIVGTSIKNLTQDDLSTAIHSVIDSTRKDSVIIPPIDNSSITNVTVLPSN